MGDWAGKSVQLKLCGLAIFVILLSGCQPTKSPCLRSACRSRRANIPQPRMPPRSRRISCTG